MKKTSEPPHLASHRQPAQQKMISNDYDRSSHLDKVYNTRLIEDVRID